MMESASEEKFQFLVYMNKAPSSGDRLSRTTTTHSLS